MTISEQVLKAGLEIFLVGLEATLLSTAKQQEIKRQREIYDGTSSVFEAPRQYTAEDGTFVPNKKQAEERAKTTIQVGVGTRLRGAIALYGVGEEMECVRNIVLALDAIFCILEWREASAWCNAQNTALFEVHRKKKAA